MIVQYTHISSLSEDQKKRLKALLTTTTVLERSSFVEFEGKVFSKQDAQTHVRMWEQERNSAGRKILLG